mgnify:CR=1 FL=1|tara:strand:+ start:134 stop:610 length:477 start_codon:yes stop_codon:yes gene_type:complete
MVCLGNICRSPTAHGVLEKMIQNKELGKYIEVDSAGTSTYHLGDHPDPRSIAAAQRRGYSLEKQVARQVSANDYRDFDYILAMDTDNLQHLENAAPADSRARVQLLLNYSEGATGSVPDPYLGGGQEGFEKVVDLVEDACQRLLEQLEQQLSNSEAEQ